MVVKQDVEGRSPRLRARETEYHHRGPGWDATTSQVIFVNILIGELEYI